MTSHYVELLKIDDSLEHFFYKKEEEIMHRGVWALKSQMNSMLFTGGVRKLIFWYDANVAFKKDIAPLELKNWHDNQKLPL